MSQRADTYVVVAGVGGRYTMRNRHTDHIVRIYRSLAIAVDDAYFLNRNCLSQPGLRQARLPFTGIGEEQGRPLGCDLAVAHRLPARELPASLYRGSAVPEPAPSRVPTPDRRTPS